MKVRSRGPVSSRLGGERPTARSDGRKGSGSLGGGIKGRGVGACRLDIIPGYRLSGLTTWRTLYKVKRVFTTTTLDLLLPRFWTCAL